jgi:hypothetical protein
MEEKKVNTKNKFALTKKGTKNKGSYSLLVPCGLNGFLQSIQTPS